MQNKKISFIGAGNMTSAIIRGLIANDYPPELIMASNPSQAKLDELRANLNIHITQDNIEALNHADFVILAVKPQIMAEVCNELITSMHVTEKCIVSLAAGITSARLSEMLENHQTLIRVMPNTPCAIGEGMSGIYANKDVDNCHVQFIKQMMEKVGRAIVLDNETDIDTVIAAAGSSPAYFFLIAEIMIKKAIKQGLSDSQARTLVEQAMLGSAQMLSKNHHISAEQLRAQVTSKGGTTFQAITHLQDAGLSDIFANAMQAAIDRSKRMSEEF